MSESITSLFRLTVVYSRQSRYGGGSFSSCDAQYAICSDTASSLGLSVHDHFADEGESSETLDRPAMRELLNAVKEDLIDRVIVYKMDRLVKPLALLAKLLAIFEEHEVNLVCGLCERPMTTSYSHHRNIRYLYYRCRSQAGGRPPCASVSVKRHDIEQFVIDTLGEPESDDPDFMEGLRKVWQQLDQDERRRLLPRLLRRVVFNPDLGSVEIECNEDEIRALIDNSPESSD